jgi:putative ABC transport system substrate-binding protein
MEDPMVESARKKIVDFATANGIPVMGEFRPMTGSGGLMSYGPNQVKMWERSAAFVDKILKGADPSNLPVEQPSKGMSVFWRQTDVPKGSLHVRSRG